jgi:hypothetical protein
MKIRYNRVKIGAMTVYQLGQIQQIQRIENITFLSHHIHLQHRHSRHRFGSVLAYSLIRIAGEVSSVKIG